MYVAIEDLTKTIHGRTVLEHVNLRMEQGTVYGLRGPNGCGKTMLMRSICGLIRPTSGSVEINGERLGREISFPRSVGALIENPAFINNYTGLRNLQLLASIQNKVDEEEIRQAITRVGLDPDDKRKYKKYSLGMKQRLGIAAAIMEHPDLLVLDEPINALDEDGVRLVRDILHQEKERGALILVACHDKEELEFLADEIYVMGEGKILRGFRVGEDPNEDEEPEGRDKQGKQAPAPQREKEGD